MDQILLIEFPAIKVWGFNIKLGLGILVNQSNFFFLNCNQATLFSQKRETK